jgi:hypothetical protein
LPSTTWMGIPESAKPEAVRFATHPAGLSNTLAPDEGA